MDHIPSRHFSLTIPFEKRFDIARQYSGSDWDYVRQFLSETQQITASAVKISKVIKHHFDINLFPSVFKVAGKGWDAAGGTHYFMMYSEFGKLYSFSDPARKFKSIKGEYDLDYTNVFYRI